MPFMVFPHLLLGLQCLGLTEPGAPVAAGTVACPLCLGSPCVHRLTPDFAKALNMGPLWDEQIVGRMGRWYWGADRPADKQKLFLEYPTGVVGGWEGYEQDFTQGTSFLRVYAQPLFWLFRLVPAQLGPSKVLPCRLVSLFLTGCLCLPFICSPCA